MANSFKGFSDKKAFGGFSESQEAGEYIYNKKAKTIFCIPNNCTPSVNFGSEGDYLLFNRSNKLTFSPCLNSINRSNLYNNLITKLDLKDVPVVQNFYPQGNYTGVPSTIINSSNITPYLDYNIDPCGNLFGNTVCGINNFVKYMKYNSFYFSYTISGNYNITSDENYDTIIIFTGNGTFNIISNYSSSNIAINYIVVGGGGGGSGGGTFNFDSITGGGGGGGGGGGEVLMDSINSNLNFYNIVIGNGGIGSNVENGNGGSGENTSIIGNNVNIIAKGGLGGYPNTVGNNTYLNGGNSGADGSGGLGGTSISINGQYGINGGGGGGGFGGNSSNSGVGGNGGINNINSNYGGGGGGGTGFDKFTYPPGKGVGGGGDGASSYENPIAYAKSGNPNTGGGGGGGLLYINPNHITYSSGGQGGSGIVILSFNNYTKR